MEAVVGIHVIIRCFKYLNIPPIFFMQTFPLTFWHFFFLCRLHPFEPEIVVIFMV